MESAVDSLANFDFSLDPSPPVLAAQEASAPWSYSLTPTVFSPGLTPTNSGLSETNPFESSFYSSHEALKLGNDHLDVAENTPGALEGTGLGRSKRQRSPSPSPSSHPQGESRSPSPVFDSPKRPRRESTLSKRPSMSSLSPVSSVVLTPPDSSFNMWEPTEKEMDDFAALVPSSIDPSYHAILAATTYAELAPISSTIATPFASSASVEPRQVTAAAYCGGPTEADIAVSSPRGGGASGISNLEFDHRKLAAASRSTYDSISLPISMFPATVSGVQVEVTPLPSSLTATLQGVVPHSSKKTKAPPSPKSKKAKKTANKEEAQNENEEEERRKTFLERNRVAACKSRQKKKERVTMLESQANDCAARNVALQSVALSLQSEVLALRKLLQYHDGCSCEHVRGYLQREAGGGGIPTINALAGHVMSIDYTNVPFMGSENDLYADYLNDDRDGDATPASASTSTSTSTNSNHSRVLPRGGRRRNATAAPALAPALGLTMSTRAKASRTSLDLANGTTASSAPLVGAPLVEKPKEQADLVSDNFLRSNANVNESKFNLHSHTTTSRFERSLSAPATTPS